MDSSIRDYSITMTTQTRYALVFIAIVILSACDGGDDGVYQGYFTDSAVSGLQYSTASQSGITDELGTFNFKSGETITFYLGGTVIGEPVKAKSELSPADLVPEFSLVTTSSQLHKILSNVRSPKNIAFRKFTNILVFLQSLDADANPENGISISENIPTLLEDVQIDFNQFVSLFRADPLLRRTMHKASSMGYLSTAAIRYHNRALDHFYAAQGIAHNLARPINRTIDDKLDGVPDSIVTWTYDSAGNPASMSLDANANGVSDMLHTWTYDARGYPTGYSLESHDTDPFFVGFYLNGIWTWTYDANGNRISTSEDINFDDIPDSLTTMVYGANGDLISVNTDADANGTPDAISSMTYDAKGNRISSSSDANADGIPDSLTTKTYDAKGNMTSINTDFDADDSVDAKSIWRYDVDGNHVEYSSDTNADGTPEYTVRWTYHDNGQLNTSHRNFYANGVLYSAEVVNFDTNGHLTSLKEDNNGDGLVDRIVLWTYDSNENLTGYSLDSNADGAPESVSTWTNDYDTYGNLISVELDSNSDDIADYIYTWTYDADGNQTSYSRDYDADGEANIQYTWIYEEARWTSIYLEQIIGSQVGVFGPLSPLRLPYPIR